MAKYTLEYLIKVGQKEHIDSLLHKGLLYMNTIEYYRDLETANNQVGDEYEGVSRIFKSSCVMIKPQEEWVKINNDPVVVRETKSTSNQGNIFCMYGIFRDSFNEKEGNYYHDFTINFNEFGDSRLLIYNPREFIRRCEVASKKQGITIIPNRAQYYDESTYEGTLSPWHKRKYYSTQSEFRFFYPNLNHLPHELYIGSIQDIACILKEGEAFCSKNNGDGTRSLYKGEVSKNDDI